MSHRFSCFCFSLCQGLKEAREQRKRWSQAAYNILPSLKSADGVNLRDIDDCSQGFQSGTASLAHLPRQSVSVKLNTGRVEYYNPFPKTARARPRLRDAWPSHLPAARSSSVMYLASGTSATSPAPPPRPPALQHDHQLAGAFQNQHARSLRSPQHHGSPSELSSKRRLKPVWTSMHFPHLPLSQRVSLAFRAVLHCLGDRSSIPRSGQQHGEEQSSWNSISDSIPLLTTKLN